MYSSAIDSTHIFIPVADLTQDINVLRHQLTIKPKFDNLEPVKVYSEIKGYFGFPRFYADFRKLAKEYVDKREDGAPIAFSMRYPPRPRQVPVLDQFRSALKAQKTGFLLTAPTGSGKTYMLLHALSELRRTALIIVPREHIVQQWIDRILEHTSLKMDDIGVVQQSRCEFEGKSLVIGMIHSLSKDKYSVKFKRWPGVAVFDEIHVTGAKTFSKTVSMFPARYRIGATATPTRPDGMDPVFRLALGEVTLVMRGGTDVLPKVVFCDYLSRRVPAKLAHIHDSISRRGVIISAIAGDVRRNVLLAFFVNKLARSGRRTLFLSDRKQQLDDIREILVSRYRFDYNEIGIFVQETPKARRQAILDECKIILATYGMMSMAVDVPDLAGLVFGTPQSHITQPVGRVLRASEHKLEPVVIDVIDLAFEECVRWAGKRKQHYREMCATLHNFTFINDQAT